eukprot:GHVT01048578.1.p1 GENE.GHVT01048578.1~~GHVT01048578.1.p1  ORF type:complete len:331 (-),score=86.19 GHVT01048578.1:1860-2852(-)
MAPNASPVRDFEVSLAFVQDLARNAGRMIVSGLADPTKEVKFKLGPGDLVTETDEAVEAKLKQIINLKFPEHLFLCEESSPADESLTDAPTWIIDPIDGTTNFVHAFPFTCVSIAFARRKQVVVGVVFNPVLDELYSAELGGGSYLNGRRLRTSRCDGIQRALVGVEVDVKSLSPLAASTSTSSSSASSSSSFSSSSCSSASSSTTFARGYMEATLGNLEFLFKSSRGVRIVGASAVALAFVAAGRLDAVIAVPPKPWDMAAGQLLVSEAGGIVTDLDGSSPLDLLGERILAAATPELSRQLAQSIMFVGRPKASPESTGASLPISTVRH